jgi:hypothetical protein
LPLLGQGTRNRKKEKKRPTWITITIRCTFMAALLTAKRRNYDSSSCQGIAWWGGTAAICAPTISPPVLAWTRRSLKNKKLNVYYIILGIRV